MHIWEERIHEKKYMSAWILEGAKNCLWHSCRGFFPSLQAPLFFDHQKTAEQIVCQLAGEISSALADLNLSAENLLGIGLGAPGTPTLREGKIPRLRQCPTINDYPLGPHLKSIFRVPVIVDNDANIAAICEHRLGGRAWLPPYDLLHRFHGNRRRTHHRRQKFFPGAATTVPGKSATPSAPIKLAGEIPYSNPGSVESYAGGRNVCQERSREKIRSGEPTLMKDMAAGGKITGQIIKAAYEQGDAMAAQALDQIGEYLGLLYFNLYQILNINCYVIGGGLTNFEGELFSTSKAFL